MGGRVGGDVLSGLGILVANFASGTSQGFANQAIKQREQANKIALDVGNELAGRGLLHSSPEQQKALQGAVGKKGLAHLISLSQSNASKARLEAVQDKLNAQKAERGVSAGQAFASFTGQEILGQTGPFAPGAAGLKRPPQILLGPVEQADASKAIRALPESLPRQPTALERSARTEQFLANRPGTATIAGEGDAVRNQVAVLDARRQQAASDLAIRKFNAEENKVNILDGGIITREDGTKVKQWVLADKQGQQLGKIEGDVSAPEVSSFAKQVADMRRFEESGNPDDAALMRGKIMSDMANRGFSFAVLPDGTVSFSQGGEGDKVLQRNFVQQQLAIDQFRGALTQIDGLNLIESDFGLGGLVQAIGQRVTGQVRGLVLQMVGGVNAQEQARQAAGIAMRDKEGNLIKSSIAKWFNPRLPAKELLFNTLAIMRAGVFGQEGRGLSDKDMERQVKAIKASTFNEWQAIRNTLIDELNGRESIMQSTAEGLKLSVDGAGTPRPFQQPPAAPSSAGEGTVDLSIKRRVR